MRQEQDVEQMEAQRRNSLNSNMQFQHAQTAPMAQSDDVALVRIG